MGQPAYHQPAYHHAPAYHGYEHPKHNCSVLDVVEAADVCTPHIDTTCAPVDLSRKSVKDVEQCYDVTRTVCTESTEVIDNEVCTYTYQPKNEETTGKTVEVTFAKPPITVTYPEPIKTCVNKPINLPRISCED